MKSPNYRSELPESNRCKVSSLASSSSYFQNKTSELAPIWRQNSVPLYLKQKLHHC